MGSRVCITTVYYPLVFHDDVTYLYASPINSSSVSAVRVLDPHRVVTVLNAITILCRCWTLMRNPVCSNKGRTSRSPGEGPTSHCCAVTPGKRESPNCWPAPLCYNGGGIDTRVSGQLLESKPNWGGGYASLCPSSPTHRFTKRQVDT